MIDDLELRVDESWDILHILIHVLDEFSIYFLKVWLHNAVIAGYSTKDVSTL